MSEKQNEKMKWILFWVLLILFIIITLLTILELFFNLFKLPDNYKSKLFTVFIVEIGIGVIALFYSLFALKSTKKETEAAVPNVETESLRDVDVVKDSPLAANISLDKPVDLFQSFNGRIKSMLGSSNFTENYMPVIAVFKSKDLSYTAFRPNIVIQLEQNPLLLLNMTLADYMDSSYSQTQEMLNIIGKRQVRSGVSIATQWYECRYLTGTTAGENTEIKFTQFQKLVVSDNLMGIITISYGSDTKPDDIKILQELLTDFGLK